MSRLAFLLGIPIIVVGALAACSDQTSGGSSTSITPPFVTSTTEAVDPATSTTLAEDEISVSTLVAEIDIATGGVAVDEAGNLYVANIGPAPRRRGTRVFRVTPAGAVSLFVEDDRLRGASGNAVDEFGNLYQSAFTAGAILRITPDGTVEEFADDGVQGPVGVVIDPVGGGLFVADCRAGTVLEVSSSGAVFVFADDPLLACPNGITRDPDGNLYVANFSDGRVLLVTPDGAVSELAVVPGDSNGHLVYAGGVLYVVGRGANQIFTVSLDGEVEVLAGSGNRGNEDGPAPSASFSLPNGIAIGPDGTIYINEVASVSGSQNFPTALRAIRLSD